MTVTTEHAAPYRRSDGLWVFSRAEFTAERFDCKPGEHVVFAGPTQRGKTTLGFQLLEHTATSEMPAYVAVSKPRDPTTERFGKQLGYRRLPEWPPSKRISDLWEDKPSGYLIWPEFGDIDNDTELATQVTRKLIQDRYRAGKKGEKSILVMDDTVIKSKVLGLDPDMTTVLAMGGAMDVSIWTFVQKPTGAGNTAIWSYGNSEHVFLLFDGDKRNRDRYGEIGGVDPKFVASATQSLRMHQFLYIKREGFMCVVDK